MGWWLKWFGVLVGGLSIASLLHKYWPYKLAALSADVLEFYQAVFHPAAKLIALAFSHIIWISLPPDLVVMWLLIGGACVRGTSPRDWNDWGVILLVCIMFLLWPAILAADVYNLYLSPQKQEQSKMRNLLRLWMRELFRASLAFLLFFCLNAGFA